MMKLLYGSYGHHPSGKQYVYWGNDNMRTGQNVVAPVTNKFSGKTYNTMFTIQRTSQSNSAIAENEAQRLESSGINIKSIKGRDVMSLPGASDWSSASQWKQWSDLVREEDLQNRLASYSTDTDTRKAENQLFSY